MQIDPNKCVACSNCVPVCPMGAIYVDPQINRATINYDECVECGTCHRMSGEHLNPTMVRTVRKLAKFFRFRFEPEPDVCPTSAFVMEELEWPRIARRVFSDPLVEHKSTGIKGRGTEALAKLGVTFEPKNPISHLMTDKSQGTIQEDILNEKILSAIVEIKTTIHEVSNVLDTVMEVAKTIDTVVALGVSTRCGENGEDPVLAPLLEELGYEFERAKTNMGLGRITNVQKKEEVGDQHLAPVR